MTAGTCAGPTRTRSRRMVSGTPRAVLRAGAQGLGVDAGDVAAAARVARCPRRVVDAWEAVANGEEALRNAARRELAAWLDPAPSTRLVDVDHALARALARAEQCGETFRVFSEAGVGLHAVPAPCKARVCASCQRRALRAVLDRWRPLFAAPVRPGYVVSFVTLTSTRTVDGPEAVARFTRALGRFVYAMREGVPRFGIEPRSWVAGVRAFELVPRVDGGFGHAHLLVVRRAFVPFGKASANLPPNPSPSDLGTRALLRSLGLGEVMRYDDVTTDRDGEGATAVESYMGKVESYMGKVEKGDGTARTWSGRSDLQRAMRGVRLVEAFGDARGLLGGPDATTRTRNGEPCAPWTLEGTYDPADPDTWHVLPGGVAVDDGPEVTVDRRTYYRADTLDTWREWCDVDALVAGMRLDGRAPPHPVEGADKRHGLAERAKRGTPPKADARRVPAPRRPGNDDGETPGTETAAGHVSTPSARCSSARKREHCASTMRRDHRRSACEVCKRSTSRSASE